MAGRDLEMNATGQDSGMSEAGREGAVREAGQGGGGSVTVRVGPSVFVRLKLRLMAGICGAAPRACSGSSSPLSSRSPRRPSDSS